MTALIDSLKKAGEDFEFYPSTEEQIKDLFWAIKAKNKNSFYSESATHSSGLFKHKYQSISFLEIGAGNCKVYKKINEISKQQEQQEEYINCEGNKIYLSESERKSECLNINRYYVMEKSRILLDQFPPEAITVGTDFMCDTLIDKEVDIIFCNPPYREYAQWVERIITEGNAALAYIILPRRWGNHPGIASALKKRKAKVKVIGHYHFLNSEDRKARAKVSLIEIDLRGVLRSRKNKRKMHDWRDEKKPAVDPFELWFDEHFKINADVAESDFAINKREHEKRENTIKNELAKGELIEVLVDLYNKELNQLVNNYQKLSEIDANLLRELDVKIESVKLALKSKIKSLKIFYWEEIFSNLDKITSRLTSQTRDLLRRKLAENTNIDFTTGNIRAILIWILKNCSKYYEQQMLTLYDELTTADSLRLYKSNQHFIKDSWRYLKDNIKEGKVKYSLDYRIVLHSWRGYLDKTNCLTENQMTALRDMIVVARNLGFIIPSGQVPYEGLPLKEENKIYFNNKSYHPLKKKAKTIHGKIEEVYYFTRSPNENGERVMDKDGITYVYDKTFREEYYQYLIDGTYYHQDGVMTDEMIFVAARGHHNGNIHYKLNSDLFLKKFNLEVSRLRGWVKNAKEAADEIEGLSLEEAEKYWKSTYTLLPEHLPQMLPEFASLESNDEYNEEYSEEFEGNAQVTQEQMAAFENGTLF